MTMLSTVGSYSTYIFLKVERIFSPERSGYQQKDGAKFHLTPWNRERRCNRRRYEFCVLFAGGTPLLVGHLGVDHAFGL
jgi:hypothetical protein